MKRQKRSFSDAEILSFIEHQQKGVGRLLMEKVNREFSNTSIFFESLPDTEGFAEKCGFRKNNMTVYSKRSN